MTLAKASLSQLPLGRLDERPQGAQLHRRVEERVRQQLLGGGPLVHVDLREGEKSY